MPGSSPGHDDRRIYASRTPRRAAARIALHAGAIPHQREVAALAAHLALVALGLGFGAAFGLGGGQRLRGAGLAPLQRFELLGRREIVGRFLLQRDGAFDGVADAGAGAPWEASAVTLLPPPGAVVACATAAEPPRMTTRLSVRERVRPFDRYLVAWLPVSSGSLPSSTPLPSASKFDFVRIDMGEVEAATCSSPRVRGRRSRGSRSRT